MIEYSITIRNECQEILARKLVSQLGYQGGKFSLKNWKSQDDSRGLYTWKEKESGNSYRVWSEKTIESIRNTLDTYSPACVEESMAYEETLSVLQWISSKQNEYSNNITHIVFESCFYD